MDNNFDIIYRTEKKIVYRIPSFGSVTGDFLRALVWPSGVSGFIFLFEEGIVEEHAVLSALPLDLDVGLVYSAEKTSLSGSLSSPELFQRAPGNADTLAELYLRCRKMVLSPVLSARAIPPVNHAAVLAKMKKQLAEGKVGVWVKNGTPVGALAVTNWHDFADKPVQWIPWVWISESLLPEERSMLHGQISTWLKLNVSGRVQCVVDSYNVRSQKFFRKMGFLPECLHIVKQ